MDHGNLRGVGIQKIEQISSSMDSLGANVIRVTLDDGSFYDYTVRNGDRGPAGSLWIGTSEPPDDSYSIWLNPSGMVSGYVGANQGAENAGRVLAVGEDGVVIPREETPYTLPQASPDALGGIKADAAETADTQPVRIGGDGKLYTAPGGGGADISLGISGATAGQVAKVKAVDASGAPTAWEAGDAASGGSGTNGEKLLVEYVHSSNEMYQPTSFDPGTGIFTCPSHGLVGNTGCFVVMNNDAAFDTTKVPKGNYAATLVPVDNDSFTINGWDYASDANVGNIDCSSFHYEHCVTFTIKDIPLYKKIRVVMLGKVFCASWLGFDCSLLSGTLLFDTADTGSYFLWGRPGYAYGRADGVFFLDSDIFVGDNETVTTRKIWRSDSNNNNKQFQNYLARKKNANTGDSFTITSSYSGNNEQGFANGFVVKVYGYGGKNENSSVQ